MAGERHPCLNRHFFALALICLANRSLAVGGAHRS